MENLAMTNHRSHIKVSVIMLTCNREHMVGRAINSIKQQSFNDFEFIIVDNGSTDASGIIAENFAKEDERIKVLHIEKNTIAAGRNIGLENAVGDFILFVDDDDYAEKDMLEFLYSLSINHMADIAICGSTKEINGKVVSNYIFKDLISLNKEQGVIEMLKREKYNVAMPTKLFKRNLFSEIQFVNQTNYDDIWIGYKLFAAANKTVAHGIQKYCFCQHNSNSSAFTTNDALLTERQLDEYLNAFRERTTYLSKKLPKIRDYALYSELSYMISMCNKIITNELVHCKNKLHYMREILSKNYDWFYKSTFIKSFEKEYMLKFIERNQRYS